MTITTITTISVAILSSLVGSIVLFFKKRKTKNDPDEIKFDKLQWVYGPHNGSNAKLDYPRLSDLKFNGSRVYYNWVLDMSGWNIPYTEHRDSYCAVFFKRNGRWEGGMFDWVSSSRSDRELKHVNSYENWPSSGIKLPFKGEIAFVVVHKNGQKRSNVVKAKN